MEVNERMYCHECGYKLPDEAAFCPICGTKVIQADLSGQREERISPTMPDGIKDVTFSLGSAGEDFIHFVNEYVQSTTSFHSAMIY